MAIRCLRCSGDMVEANLNQSIRVQRKAPGIKGVLTPFSNVEARVCPQCGYVELVAERPDKIKGD